MLRSSIQPRINEEIKKVLQLSNQSKTRDSYLYQNHTEIRVYGSQLVPYMLPKYLSMRLFALEYIRKNLNSNEIHFISAKKKTQIKIKNQIGPFICINRNLGKEANRFLQEFKFRNNLKWNYDPLGVISKLRVKLKLTPFIHESKTKIEKYSNQWEWLKNTL